MITEYAWVIEGVWWDSVPVYWDGYGECSFDKDHQRAIRFARKDDAERVLRYIIRPSANALYKVVEHGWG